MRFDVITIFPDMFAAIKTEGIIARGIKKSLLCVHTWQLRDFSENKHKNIDDRPYGGGAGMIMQVKPIRKCIAKIKKLIPDTKVIYLSPYGIKLTNAVAKKLSNFKALTLLCGRYEGIDERIIEHDIDLEISIGDYIISGGELAAMIIIDSVSRHIPYVLGNKDSLNDSLKNQLSLYPNYSRPQEIDGQKVPEILINGHQANIDTWRQQQHIKKTKQKHKSL